MLFEILIIALPVAIVAFFIYSLIYFLKLRKKEKNGSEVTEIQKKDSRITLSMASTLIIALLALLFLLLGDPGIVIAGIVLAAGVPILSLTFFIVSLVRYKKAKKLKKADSDSVSDEEISKRKFVFYIMLAILGTLLVCIVILYALMFMMMMSM